MAKKSEKDNLLNQIKAVQKQIEAKDGEAAALRSTLEELAAERKEQIDAFEAKLLAETQDLLKKLFHDNKSTRPLRRVVLIGHDKCARVIIGRKGEGAYYNLYQRCPAFRNVCFDENSGEYRNLRPAESTITVLSSRLLKRGQKPAMKRVLYGLSYDCVPIVVSGCAADLDDLFASLPIVVAYFCRQYWPENAIKKAKELFESKKAENSLVGRALIEYLYDLPS